jgi:hypothetical protein
MTFSMTMNGISKKSEKRNAAAVDTIRIAKNQYTCQEEKNMC